MCALNNEKPALESKKKILAVDGKSHILEESIGRFPSLCFLWFKSMVPREDKDFERVGLLSEWLSILQ